ncbi:hypothetical protein ACLOJK_025797 [Asimina triloba]
MESKRPRKAYETRVSNWDGLGRGWYPNDSEGKTGGGGASGTATCGASFCVMRGASACSCSRWRRPLPLALACRSAITSASSSFRHTMRSSSSCVFSSYAASR